MHGSRAYAPEPCSVSKAQELNTLNMTERKGISAERPLQCEVCQRISKTRCQRCRAYVVCSPECFKIGWPNHKVECKKLQESRRLAESSGYVPARPNGVEPISFNVESDVAADLMRINQEASNIYSKYDVEDPPGKDSSMPSKKKVDFYVELLQLYDSGSEQNKPLGLRMRLFFNRRYNNTYRWAVELFKDQELDMLHSEMMRLRIGDGFRSGYRV